MTKKITLDLPDEIAVHAFEIAKRSQREIEAVLLDWLGHYVSNLPVESLSDQEILMLCDFEMNPVQQREMNVLLYEHRERKLTAQESERMDELVRIYRKGIIRKAQARQIAEARGLVAGTE